jgi:hypothetical protein
VTRQIIQMLLEKYKRVHVKWCDANHDPTSAAWMREFLVALYSNEPRVSIDNSPDTYYEKINERVKGHEESIDELRDTRVLIDGDVDSGILLQIFTNTVIGPVFFEIIQRKGNQGFGEGNFKALFESIELDQMRRGVLD